MTFGAEKLKRFDYPTVSKNFEDVLIRFDEVHDSDRQTDGRTGGHLDTA